MRLKIHQVFNAVQALDAIIREKRRMPQLGKFRLARMHAKLLPEFVTANAQREELIRRHGNVQPDGQFMVGPAAMRAFTAEWEPIAEAEVDVDVEPISVTSSEISLAAPGDWDEHNGPIEASELLLLGDLVTE